MFTTTIYSQDFKDVEGDALVGRKTVPIKFPILAGPVLAATIQAWTVFLIILWRIGLATSVLFGGLAVCVSLSFITSRTVLGYQRAYYMYNVSRVILIFYIFSLTTESMEGMDRFCPLSPPFLKYRHVYRMILKLQRGRTSSASSKIFRDASWR